MKRILLAVGIIVAIIVLLAPTIVFAGSSGTVTVSGHLGTTIELTTPGAITFPDFHMGVNSASSTQGSVSTNATTWSVSAIDQNTDIYNYPGRMVSGSNRLSGKLQIGTDGNTYSDADMGITYNKPTTFNLYVQQNISSSDKPGDYTITIKLTATGS